MGIFTLIRNHTNDRKPGRPCCLSGRQPEREHLPISGAQDHPGDASTVCVYGRWAFSNDPPQHAEKQQIDPYDLYCTLLVGGHSKPVCGGPAFSESPTTVPRLSAGTVHATNQTWPCARAQEALSSCSLNVVLNLTVPGAGGAGSPAPDGRTASLGEGTC